jgi:hypothetical protein
MKKTILALTTIALLAACGQARQKQTAAESNNNELQSIANEIPKNNDCYLAEWKNGILAENIESEESISEFIGFDFSFLWLDKRIEYIGYIGNDYQKMDIQFDNINKSPHSEDEYIVVGTSLVKQNKCNFQGVIKITNIRKLKELNYGVDDWMKGKVKDAGIIIAEFEFVENAEQHGSGVFKGLLYSCWYVDNEDVLKYDDIQIYSDNYANNQFLGSWISHATNEAKRCAWGQYRIPCSGDLDIGDRKSVV